MTIRAFNAGINTRIAPHLLGEAASQVYINCDNESGPLIPTKSTVASGVQAKHRWEYFSSCDKVMSSDTETYWVEYVDTIYQADGAEVSILNCDGTTTKLGIDKPEHPLHGEEAGDGNLDGTYQYLYTYYNSANGFESAPNELSNEVAINNPEPEVSDERLNFRDMGTQILAMINDTTTSNEARLDSIKCALDKYTYTIPELVDYVIAMTELYENTDGDTVDVIIDSMECTTYGTPEIFETIPSYMMVVTNIKRMLDSSRPADAILIGIGCVVDNSDRCTEQYGTEYHEMVDNTVSILSSSVPADKYLGDDEWKLAQISCVVENEDTTPSEPEATEVHGKQILVTGFEQSSDSQVDTIRLYRIGGTLSTYSLVEELAISTTSYMDNNSDADIAGNHVLDSFVNGKPPQDGKYFSEANTMLFLAKGEKLYFSELAKPYAWPATNYIDFDTEITGIGNVQNGLLVFTRYKTYIITGTSPLVMSKYLISGEQGCVNHDTIAFVENNLFWLSTDGVCTSNGGHVTIVTQPLLGRLARDDSINAWQHDRMYFLALSDKIVILDNRYEYCIRELNYTGWLGAYKDNMYIQQDGELHKLFSGENDTMYYLSPVFSVGRFTEYKVFKDIYIAFKGQIHIKVWLHTHDKPDQLILEKELDTKHLRRNLKCKALAGYGISIEVSGTGEVHEIDFTAVGRENGK